MAIEETKNPNKKKGRQKQKQICISTKTAEGEATVYDTDKSSHRGVSQVLGAMSSDVGKSVAGTANPAGLSTEMHTKR